MLKNIFKNFVKSTLVIFIALILSNFLPALIQSQQTEDFNHAQQIFDSQFSLIQTTHADPNGNTTGSTQANPTTSILPQGFEQISQQLRSGNYTKAIELTQKKITELLPFAEFLKTLSYPLFIVIGALLDNQIFTSPVMRDVLGNVWSQVRNLCYYILVIYFVFIAIYNVFAGSSDSQYSLKKGLQEIAIAFVLINFSWYGATLVLDVSNVAINITYSWATQYQNTTYVEGSSVDSVAKMCKLSQLSNTQLCEDNDKKKDFQSFLQKVDQRSLPLNIAIRFGKVLDVDKINPSTIKASDPIALVAVFLVKIFIFILQFFAYLMLAYYLVIRIIYIWVYIALSPIIVLDKVMSGLSIDASEHFQKFFDYALIGPIKGAVGFTLSYMILDSISRTPAVYNNNQILDTVALSIGSLDSFQALLVYFASIAVIYEITLNMADGTAAAGAFSWLRGKVQGTGKFVGSLAANTGVFIGSNKTNAKQFAGKFFPDQNTLSNSSQDRRDPGGGNRNAEQIKSGDTAEQVISKFNNNQELNLPAQSVTKIMANPGLLKGRVFSPNKLIDQANLPADRSKLRAWFKAAGYSRSDLQQNFRDNDGKIASLQSS